MHPHSPDSVPSVLPERANDMVTAGALLLDVREQDEWDESRIHGAEFKPMTSINDWYRDLPNDRAIVVYCHTGVRSEAVVKALTQQAGMADVHNMTGGITAWENRGLPLERTTS